MYIRAPSNFAYLFIPKKLHEVVKLKKKNSWHHKATPITALAFIPCCLELIVHFITFTLHPPIPLLLAVLGTPSMASPSKVAGERGRWTDAEPRDDAAERFQRVGNLKIPSCRHKRLLGCDPWHPKKQRSELLYPLQGFETRPFCRPIKLHVRSSDLRSSLKPPETAKITWLSWFCAPRKAFQGGSSKPHSKISYHLYFSFKKATAFPRLLVFLRCHWPQLRHDIRLRHPQPRHGPQQTGVAEEKLEGS